MRAEGVKARGDVGLEMFEFLLREFVAALQRKVIRPQLIPRDLFLHKAIVGFVVIERLDDVVAVPPGIAIINVRLIAAAVGVPGGVEPVAGPAFAVVL